MATLVVRNLDDRIVAALKARATRHERRAKAEHRPLPEQALLRPRRKTFAQALKSMPNVGLDTDFKRVEDAPGDGSYAIVRNPQFRSSPHASSPTPHPHHAAP